jgi:hypothetical protein
MGLLRPEDVQAPLHQAAQQGLILALGQGLVAAALDLGQRQLRQVLAVLGGEDAVDPPMPALALAH